MAFNDITDRNATSAGGLVPCEHSNKIFKMATQQSAALRFFKHVPILTQNKSFPVMTALPKSYWLTQTGTPEDDTRLIQTSDVSWANIDMNVADIAVIIPFPRRLMSDIQAGGINLTEEIIPAIAQSIAMAIDKAIFFGIEKPIVWPAHVAAGAMSAGNVTVIDTAAANGGLRTDIMNVLKMSRRDGFQLNGAIARPGFEYDLMSETDTLGRPLFIPEELQSGEALEGRLFGREISFGVDGVFPPQNPDASDIEMIMFDRTKHLVGVREELHISVHKDGVIQDLAGNIMLNLMQADSIAIKAVARIGFCTANPVTVAQPLEADRYPASILISADETP